MSKTASKAGGKAARAAVAAALVAAMACCAAALSGCAQDGQQAGNQATEQAAPQAGAQEHEAVLQVCHGEDCRFFPVAVEAGGQTSVKMGHIEVEVTKDDDGCLLAQVGDAAVEYADGAEGKNKDVEIKWYSNESFEKTGAALSESGEATSGGCTASDCGMRSGGGCTCGKGATAENDKDGNGTADCLEGHGASGK